MQLNEKLFRVPQRLARVAQASWASISSNPIVVLNYHRVGEPTSWANNLSVSVENFREHMRWVAQEFQPIRLSSVNLNEEGEIELPVSSDRERRPVIVTFDDAYRGVMELAVPILREFKVPSTIFVSTGYLQNQAEFWWDELEDLLLVGVGDHQFKVVTRQLETLMRAQYVGLSRGEVYLRLCEAVKLSEHAEDLLDVLFTMLRKAAGRSSAGKRPSHQSVDRKELKQLANEPLIEFGAHTIHHPALAQLSEEEQITELRDSKEFLEKELGRPMRDIAYPFGSDGTYSETTKRIAREQGYTFGFTTHPGLVSRSADHYELPRLYVQDWTGAEFNKKLKRFFWMG